MKKIIYPWKKLKTNAEENLNFFNKDNINNYIIIKDDEVGKIVMNI